MARAVEAEVEADHGAKTRRTRRQSTTRCHLHLYHILHSVGGGMYMAAEAEVVEAAMARAVDAAVNPALALECLGAGEIRRRRARLQRRRGGGARRTTPSTFRRRVVLALKAPIAARPEGLAVCDA